MNCDNCAVAVESGTDSKSYEERVREWVRAVRDLKPAPNGGLVPAPPFPSPPAEYVGNWLWAAGSGRAV
jgi:hypothetical protein